MSSEPPGDGTAPGTRCPEEILSQVLELPPESRGLFLETACAGDPALQSHIQSLCGLADRLAASVEGRELPDRVGRYVILALLGQGGMGCVYRAVDPTLGRPVAIKTLLDRRPGASDATRFLHLGREQLEHEARLLASLNHPHIATIHALEYDGDAPFLVMEWVDGRTLAELLATDALDLSQRLQICLDVAAGVEAAHERGIIHRDLKPANVIAKPTGTAKILDFGIARVREITISPDSGSNGHETRLAGTPDYMSPEQLRGDPVDHRADIWAFGRILCDCFDDTDSRTDCGASPSTPTGSPAPYLGRRLRFREVPAGPRQRLERLAAVCLREDPADRPGSISVVRRELDGVLRAVRSREQWKRACRVAIPALVVLALAVAGIRKADILPPSDYPTSVRAAGERVEIRTSSGRTVVCVPPADIEAAFDAALLLSTGPKPHQRIVAAATAHNWQHEARVFLWDRDGGLVAQIPTTPDNPFASGVDGPDVSARKQILRLSATRDPGRFDMIEYAHYYPSVYRAFSLITDTPSTQPTEIYRLHHAGHINVALPSTGFESQARWIWMSGHVQNGGLLREAANGADRKTQFLACFDGTARGTEVFPWFELPDSLPALEPRRNDATGALDVPMEAAVPLVYIVLRSFSGSGTTIDWTDGEAFSLEDILRETPEEVSILLRQGFRFDFRRTGPASLDVRVTLTGALRGPLQARARSSGVSEEDLVQAFLADSVVFLAVARPGLSVTGDLCDIRHALPRLRGMPTATGEPFASVNAGP